jgi:hypothetical protein
LPLLSFPSRTRPRRHYLGDVRFIPSAPRITCDDVGSGLTDYRIQPDPGSINPWQRAGRAGRSYTVNLTSQVTAGQADTLPPAPAGTTSGAGYLVYRVYLPSSGHFSTVPLPGVSFTLDGITRTVPRCPDTATSPHALARYRHETAVLVVVRQP